MTPPTVRFHLDFVSPYTWLALMQAERFAEEHGVRWEPRPLVYAALLSAHGLVGPVETRAKRRYTILDVVRCARRAGLRLTGPPEHPFRSLEALRTLQTFREEPGALRLAVHLADACWGRGERLTDAAVLRRAVTDAGLDPHGIEERIATPEVKDALRRATDEATGEGIFGVPTFVHEGEAFWGHDRLPHLADRIHGRVPPARDLVGDLLDRPVGAQRARS